MTNSEIPEEAVTAAAKAFHEHDKHDPWDDEGCNDSGGGEYPSCKEWTLEGARAMLAAALPHLRVQKTPPASDLIAKAEALEAEADAAIGTVRGPFGLPFAAVSVGHLRAHTAALRVEANESPAPHPRPVVDREAVINAIASQLPEEVWDEQVAADAADVVLALLPTEEGEGHGQEGA